MEITVAICLCFSKKIVFIVRPHNALYWFKMTGPCAPPQCHCGRTMVRPLHTLHSVEQHSRQSGRWSPDQCRHVFHVQQRGGDVSWWLRNHTQCESNILQNWTISCVQFCGLIILCGKMGCRWGQWPGVPNCIINFSLAGPVWLFVKYILFWFFFWSRVKSWRKWKAL